MWFETLPSFYRSIPQEDDRFALEDDDECAREIPAQRDSSDHPESNHKVQVNFEEAIEEEEDRNLDERHAQLVDDLGGEEDLELSAAHSIRVTRIPSAHR